MPAPRRPLVDTGDILGDMRRNPMSKEELARHFTEGQKRHDADVIAWLKQYDDQGRLIPSAISGIAFIPNMSLYFLDLSPEEKIAYIIEKKKEYGLL